VALTIPAERRTLFGLLVTVAGALVFVPDALVLRLTGTDLVAVAFWRGFVSAPVFLVAVALTSRLPPLRWYVSRPVLPVVLAEGVSTVLFCASIGATTVANTLVIMASAPFIAAAMSRVILGERIPPQTLTAILVTFAGVVIIATGGLGGVAAGDAIAVANAVSLAALLVALRMAGERNMIPAVAAGQIIGTLLAAPFAAFEPLGAGQIGWILLSGGLILPLGVGLITLGPRYLPAPEVAMILSLEMVTSPFLVWLVLGEAPTRAGFVGGAIVVIAVVAHGVWRLRRTPRLREAV
jgi:drug/metabolite transporter (DMT)-like permease